MSEEIPHLKINHSYCVNCYKSVDNLRYIGCIKTSHPFYTKYSREGEDTFLYFISIKCKECGFEAFKVYINDGGTYMYVMFYRNDEPEHMTYLRNSFIEALYRFKCKTCGRILIYNQRINNRSYYCDICYDFKEYVYEQNKNKTLVIDLGMPDNPVCIICGNKIDVMMYMARRDEYKNNKCYDCTKKDIEAGL